MKRLAMILALAGCGGGITAPEADPVELPCLDEVCEPPEVCVLCEPEPPDEPCSGTWFLASGWDPVAGHRVPVWVCQGG